MMNSESFNLHSICTENRKSTSRTIRSSSMLWIRTIKCHHRLPFVLKVVSQDQCCRNLSVVKFQVCQVKSEIMYEALSMCVAVWIKNKIEIHDHTLCPLLTLSVFSHIFVFNFQTISVIVSWYIDFGHVFVPQPE